MPNAIAIALGILLSVTGCSSGTYFNDATVYAGLEYAPAGSSVCVMGYGDPRTTGNLGAKLNVYQSDSKRLRLNAKYRHLSCAFNEDINVYNAIGAEVAYKVWER